MIVFEQCRIDDAGKKLIIEAAVENLKYYDDVYISDIIITTEEGYTTQTDILLNKPDIPEDCKRLRLCLNSDDLNKTSLNDHIFFIYIITKGYPAPDTPCGMDNHTAMTIAVNMRPIYNKAMGYIRELKSTCDIPRGFIDMILRLKAFNLSLRTGNYPVAIEQWKTFFKDKINVSSSKGCGCHAIGY